MQTCLKASTWILVFGLIGSSCTTILPVLKTQQVIHDTDDPAIWINAQNPAQSIVFGTDKQTDGAIYAFDLHGQILEEKTIRNIHRPNNVDVEYGMMIAGHKRDILVFTEREREMLRIYSIPDMLPLDNGGIQVFVNEPTLDFRAPMGVGLYKNPDSGEISAILSRKSGPTDGTYLWQYQLRSDGNMISGEVVRKFGAFQGTEIEALSVDDQAGYVYYSDEGFCIHKYYADPANGNDEISQIGIKGFKRDIEGIAILQSTETDGYLLVSDQQRQTIHFYQRGNENRFITSVRWKARETDGIEVTPLTFDGRFPGGLLVAMSEGRVFHYYAIDHLLLTK